MSSSKVYTAIGLMSGTSMDGVDAAIMRTDGHKHAEIVSFHFHPYENIVRDALRACMDTPHDRAQHKDAEALMTRAHIQAVQDVMHAANLTAEDIDVIGFHGQTIYHDPASAQSYQMGDAAMLAQETHIDVVADFRSADIKAGGQGAPFLPLYHQMRAQSQGLEMPLIVLNIGGVSNITYIADDMLMAFDTGPGNALLDDFIASRSFMTYDKGGQISMHGKADLERVRAWMDHPYFSASAPKSLDRQAWKNCDVSDMNLGDGAATLSAFTVASTTKAAEFLPAKAARWLVSGGGRYNYYFMENLRAQLGVPVETVETIGWDGDALEAEGFGYLAVRSLQGLPLSLPSTTGVAQPQTGGTLFKRA